MSTITVELKDLAIAYRCLSDAHLNAMANAAARLTLQEHEENAKWLKALGKEMDSQLWVDVYKWIHSPAGEEIRRHLNSCGKFAL